MNERIKELIIETLGKQGVIDSRAFGHWALSDEQMEKFAELIVEECVLHLHKRGVEGFGILEERNLKEHFGVEE